MIHCGIVIDCRPYPRRFITRHPGFVFALAMWADGKPLRLTVSDDPPFARLPLGEVCVMLQYEVIRPGHFPELFWCRRAIDPGSSPRRVTEGLDRGWSEMMEQIRATFPGP